jgi:sarcosine oxidase
MVTKDYVVVGGGVAGASAALELVKKNKNVLLIERDVVGPTNPISSSGDYSKVFRHSYGNDEHYTKMCAESLKLWREIESKSGKQLYFPCGMLVFGDMRVKEGWANWAIESAQTLSRFGLSYELLDRGQIHDLYPQVSNNGLYDHAILDKEAGFIKAQEAVRAAGQLAKQAGVEVWENTEVKSVEMRNGNLEAIVTSAGTVVPNVAIFAAGYLNPLLFPEIQKKTFVTRQQTAYLKPINSESFIMDKFPIVVSLREGYYAFPLHGPNNCTKISNHNKVEVIDPKIFKKTVDDKFVSNCFEFLGLYVPKLAESDVEDSRVCLYTNTKNEDFIIDRIGNAVVVSACSGHGFKFGPLTGKMAAQLALGETPVLMHDRFRLQSHKDV